MGIKKEGDTSTSLYRRPTTNLEAAARQFEAIFTQMWMKSMREANSALQDEETAHLTVETLSFIKGHDGRSVSGKMLPPAEKALVG